METAQPTHTDRLSLLQRGPASEILRLLQRNGPMSTKQLRAALGVSSLNAVREQLTHLAASDLVETTVVRQGAGRPTHMYALSAKAQALFPQGYDVLLHLLIEEIAAQEGQERLDAILAGVSARLADQYGGPAQQEALEQRLAELTEVLAARGIPMRVVEQDDTLTLHKHSCPYFNVAQHSAEVCKIEQHMLECVLGRKVQVTQRIVDGFSSCQFVIENVADGDTEPRHIDHP